jgi:IS605 OrfB family transposase
MRTYNVKLKFDKQDDYNNLLESVKLNQVAWNIISEERFSMTGGRLKILHDKCYKKVKQQIPNIPSQFIIKAEQDVIATYKTIKSNKHKLDSPATKKNLSIQLDKRIYKWIDKSKLKITTLNKQAIASFDTYDKLNELDFSKLKDPKLFFRNDCFYLSLIFDDNIPFVDNHNVVGVDLGLKRLISTSDGDIIKGNEFNKHKRKIRWNKRKLQSKKKSHSARTKHKKLRTKEANFSRNYIHNVTKKVIQTSKANIIVMEDLSKIKSKNKGKRFNNRLSQLPFFAVRSILTYKAQLYGKKVETVNPAYTSQIDHRGLVGGKRKGCRYYGSDNVVLDADVNAAINIANRYVVDKNLQKHSISCCKALDGQVNVNSPIVGSSFRQAPMALA